MVLMRILAVLVLCMLVHVASVQAQVPEDLQGNATLQASPTPDATVQLAKELSIARRAGNTARVRELESTLFEEMPSLPAEAVPLVLPAGSEAAPEEVATPLWGNDVTIYTGSLWTSGKRQMAIDADTAGGIYVGINTRYQDTLSWLRLFRSTNGGRNWVLLSVFRSVVYPIQSFDMCVTDTSGGKWLIGCAFIVKTDKSTAGGGDLYWGSVLNDGTDWRATRIAAATPAMNFKNPSICTDGTRYSPAVTYHYVAAEYLNPANDSSRGIYYTRTTDWGKTWVAPDTSIRGFRETAPVIAIDWSTDPDSMCMAFTRYVPGFGSEIRMARNSFTATGGWKLSGLVSSANEFDPSMAIDPVRGNAIITYTRYGGAATGYDAMYLYSTDLFKTFTRDSIAVTSATEELTSVSYAPRLGSNYNWRVVYRSSAGNDTIFYKVIANRMTGFYSAAPTAISQFRPTAIVMPVVGFDRSGGDYLGNCIYAGYGASNVYFDAVDLYLDVPRDEGVPDRYALDQNYPNPFNPRTTIRYQIPNAGDVSLTVFDQLGREVARLVDARQDAGSYTVHFEGVRHASGVYYYRLQTGGFVETKKLILLK